MKYLSEYMENKQTEAFNKYGAFFAFSDTQYDEKAVKGVKYASLGAGLIAPVDNVKLLATDLKSIRRDAIQQDINENGIEAIIQRELANHECQITCDYTDALDALAGYDVTEKQVKEQYDIFFQICVDNDYF